MIRIKINPDIRKKDERTIATRRCLLRLYFSDLHRYHERTANIASDSLQIYLCTSYSRNNTSGPGTYWKILHLPH